MSKDYKEIRELRGHIEKHFKKKNILGQDYDLFIYNASLLFAVSDKDILDAVNIATKIHCLEVRDGIFKKVKMIDDGDDDA